MTGNQNCTISLPPIFNYSGVDPAALWTADSGTTPWASGTYPRLTSKPTERDTEEDPTGTGTGDIDLVQQEPPQQEEDFLAVHRAEARAAQP